MVSKSKFTDNQ